MLARPTGVSAQAHIISLAPHEVAANEASFMPRVSADGLRIVFVSLASNLVAGDNNGKRDVFLWDGRASSQESRIVLLSVNNAGQPGNDGSEWPSISPDGDYVAFNSQATNFGVFPTNGWNKVYVRHIGGPRATWTTTLASRPYNGQEPEKWCDKPSMSDVGLVAFGCYASNMVPGDTNDLVDVFVAGLSGQWIQRVSTTSAGAQTRYFPDYAYGYSEFPSISADGWSVAFQSSARNLVSGDTNGAIDVFVKNLATGELLRMNGHGNAQPNAASLRPAISGDGRYVAFESKATNMVESGTKAGWSHVYRTSVEFPQFPKLVSVGSDGKESPAGGIRASINYDGKRVSFEGPSGVPYEGHDQVFVWTSSSLPPFFSVMQASRTPEGASADGVGYEQASLAPSTYTDPGFAVWSSSATTLDTLDTNLNKLDVFVRAFERGVREVFPPTTIAVPRAGGTAGNTNVNVVGDKVGAPRVETLAYWGRFFLRPTSGPLREAASGAPTVTVGGVAALGVSTPDANTLRFTAPALPAGSSNVAVIRYADGEIVTLPVPLRAMALVPGSTTDTDADTLPDWWELTYGLDPNNAADAGAAQANGLTPVQALTQQHHPTATATRYLAEGATGTLFQTRIALANPGELPATALLRYAKSTGTLQTHTVVVPAMGRATVDVEAVSGMGRAEFATAVESDLPLVVDRTLRWGGTAFYGAHAETSVAAPALTWYLAEGATHSGFNLFYLLQNPNTTEAQVRVRYLRPSGAPLEKTYALPPNSRTNIWVNQEVFPGLGTALAATDVSAVFESSAGQPIIVERALYLDLPGQMFGAGHESAGVTAPATQWFLAEGATGPYFDLFVLIANPGTTDAQVEATYLLPDGTVLVKPYTVSASSRFNIWVDLEDARLADTAVSTTIRSTNGVPVIVERAMWWPGGYGRWHEAHNSPGATSTGTRWALAEGEVGGPRGIETYILLANTATTVGSVRVTLLFEDRAPIERTFTVAPRSRFNVDVRSEFPGALDQRFGSVVESLGASPAQIVVERAMYWNAAGQAWAAGTNALATKLP